MQNEITHQFPAVTIALDEQPGSCCQADHADRRRQWTFVLNDDGAWTWRVMRPDGSEGTSKGRFKSLSECTSDAEANGYVVWNGAERRRAELSWSSDRILKN